MHSNKLVVTLRGPNGKFLRELGDKTYVPFGSEYSIYIKNLNSVKAVVSFEIDGKKPRKDSFIVYPNDIFELKSDDDNRAFKFIAKTANISKHRGDRIDDSMIRISWQFEKELPKTVDVYERKHYFHDPYWYQYPYWRDPYPYYHTSISYSNNVGAGDITIGVASAAGGGGGSSSGGGGGGEDNSSVSVNFCSAGAAGK